MTLNDIAQRTSDRLESAYGKKLPPAWIYAQLAHETNGGTSDLAVNYNNFAGLTQTQDNGLAQPDGSNYYMSFESQEDFADYFADYLNLYEGDGLFSATNLQEYASALKSGGYFGDSVENYVNGMNNWLGNSNAIGFDDFAMIANDKLNPKMPLNIEKPEVLSPKEVGAATLEDKFFNSLYDSAIWGTFRTLAAKKDMPDDVDFKLTQEDIDNVQKELGGDYAATLYVCQNAHSAAQLRKLTAMKQADIERRERVDASGIDENTFGTIAGGLLDPLNLIPLAGAAGKVGRFARYAKLAGTYSAFNVAERSATQALTGYQQNLPMAALVGAFAGGGIPLGFDLAGKFLSKTVKTGREMMGQSLVMRDTANALAAGTKAPNQVMSSTDFLERLNKVHDVEFATQIADRALRKRLSPKKGVFVTSLKEAQQIYKEYGVDVPHNAKALYDDATNTAVLIKDNIDDLTQVEKLLWHEKGAHGLRHILKEKEYNALMEKVRAKLDNPSPAMRRAMAKAEGSRNPEEILGYLVEEAKPSNPLMKALRKAVNKAYNAAGFEGRMSDDELIDIVKAAAEVNMENSKGYRMLADGSTIYHGVHFSQNNPVNPAIVSRNIKGSLKDWARRSAILATPYSLARNSLSKIMREFGDIMMINPYKDKALKRIPVEEYKRQMVNKLNPYINKYHEARQQYILKQLPFVGRFSPQMKLDFDKAVTICYNATYGNNIAAHIGVQFDPIVIQAAKIQKELRDTIIDIAQNFDKMTGGLGENLIDKAWKNIDDETWRFIDVDKLSSFISRFSAGKKGAIAFLSDYAKTAAKRDIIRQQLDEEAVRVWQKEAQELAKKGLPASPKPQPITDTQLEEAIEKMADKWALGIVDHNTHNRGASIRDLTDGAKSLPNFRHRMPMDTSTIKNCPLGFDFSFDNELREFDFDRTVPYLCNRIAGEAALSTYLKNTNRKAEDFFGNSINVLDNVANKRREIEMELKDACDKGYISNTDVKQELEAFDYVISKIRGVDAEYKPKTYGDAYAELLTNASYFQNGGLMGVSQLGEMGGLIARCGIDCLLDIMPGIGKTLRDIQYGKAFNKNMDELTLDVMGDEVSRYIWHNIEATSTRNFRDVAAHNSRIANVADKVGNYVKTMDSVVNTINFLPKLEYTMRQSARKQTVIDVVKWVNGKDFNWWRNPFSKLKCDAAGITDADAFRQALKPYLKFDSKGKLTSFDYKALEKADPDSAIRFRTLVDYQADIAVTSSNTIGDANLLKGTSPFWRVFFQFKDFALRATHTQSMRAFKNREIEDFLSLGFSVLTTASATMVADNIKAWMRYPEDKSKREKFLKKKALSDEKSWLRILLRTPILSISSFPSDISDVLGINPLESARTTVSRKEKNKKSFVDSPDSYLGEAITQLPAVRTGFDATKALVNSSTDMYNKGRLSKDDIRLITNTMVGNTMIPAVYLREELLHNSPRQEKYKYTR